jgi:hypothetical protein
MYFETIYLEILCSKFIRDNLKRYFRPAAGAVAGRAGRGRDAAGAGAGGGGAVAVGVALRGGAASLLRRRRRHVLRRRVLRPRHRSPGVQVTDPGCNVCARNMECERGTCGSVCPTPAVNGGAYLVAEYLAHGIGLPFQCYRSWV